MFIVAGLILNLTPGPDLLYITSCSAVQGKKAGIIAALGIGVGCLVHVVAAAFGLSVLLLSSSMLFTGVKYLGAAYLFYLGIKMLRSIKKKEAQQSQLPVLPLVVIFRRAVLINILNPKVALFFLALLPQFVRADALYPAASFLFLGLLFNVNGTLVNSILAVFTSTVSKKIEATELVQGFLKTLAGALFLAFGIRLAYIS